MEGPFFGIRIAIERSLLLELNLRHHRDQGDMKGRKFIFYNYTKLSYIYHTSICLPRIDRKWLAVNGQHHVRAYLRVPLEAIALLAWMERKTKHIARIIVTYQSWRRSCVP